MLARAHTAWFASRCAEMRNHPLGVIIATTALEGKVDEASPFKFPSRPEYFMEVILQTNPNGRYEKSLRLFFTFARIPKRFVTKNIFMNSGLFPKLCICF